MAATNLPHMATRVGRTIAALAWSYGALVRRLVLRRRVPGMLVLGTIGLTVRTVLALVSGSVYLYFLQPTLCTVLVASAFLFSVRGERSLAERLAHDFVPLPPVLLSRPWMRRFFNGVSVLAFRFLASRDPELNAHLQPALVPVQTPALALAPAA